MTVLVKLYINLKVGLFLGLEGKNPTSKGWITNIQNDIAGQNQQCQQTSILDNVEIVTL